MTQSTSQKLANSPQNDDSEWADVWPPDISDLVIEDYMPVDNLISEKQQRLLTCSAYSSLKLDIPFLAAANVGLFYGKKQPPLVPDVMLSFGISIPEDWSQKPNRSYFTFNFGKPPEVAIEIVSNKVGNELGSKLQDYVRAGVAYYAVFDPLQCLGNRLLYVHELRATRYHLLDNYWMEAIELGLTFWQGSFEDKAFNWLRWCDRDGNVLLTGDKRAQQEHQRAEQERKRADREHQRAEQLAQLLRDRGINFDTL